MSNEIISSESCRITDEVWKKIEPLLPPELPKPKGGRPRIDDRKVMEAIMYVFRTGCKWSDVPGSFGVGGTIHKRFQEWQKAGVYQRMWIAGFLTYDQMKKLIWYGR